MTTKTPPRVAPLTAGSDGQDLPRPSVGVQSWPEPEQWYSCHCPAKRGEACVLTTAECDARVAHFAAWWLDTQDFYNAMQAYRWAPQEKPSDVVEAFEAVKALIRQNIAAIAKAEGR